MSEKRKIMNESSGGYMSVNREEALKKNWDRISKLTLPTSSDKSAEKKLPATEAKPNTQTLRELD